MGWVLEDTAIISKNLVLIEDINHIEIAEKILV
ncbi:hypothetical protein HYQ49_2466 [Lactobacillus crispatus]|nr:hypothetical protein [Lactobacillus crispatus]MBI1718063.1 hypothetical protein [Lactobacillus crispatus]